MFSVFFLLVDGSIESPSQNSNLNYWEQPFSQPYFDNATRRDVTATVGQMTYLHCRVRNLGDRSVSPEVTIAKYNTVWSNSEIVRCVIDTESSALCVYARMVLLNID